MAKDSSIRSFKCPSCGAPLEPEPGKSTMKCPYCNATVVIPVKLRIPAAPAPTPRVQPPAFEAPRPSSTTYSKPGLSSNESRKPAFNNGAIITTAVVVTVLAIAYFTFGAGIISSMLFAHQTLSFGSKGIGQGMFQNARTLGVDGSGNIVAADHDDGRVQVFSPDGKFISLFNISSATTDHYISSIAVSHDGKIYLASGSILIYDEKGQLLGQISGMGSSYDDVTLGADGTVYALSNTEDIVRFKSDGSIDLQIPKAVSSISGQPSDSPQLAVDGLGDMFIVDVAAGAVFKYSPEGKFINQFGEPFQFSGSCNDCNTFKPGTFYRPTGIVVDGYGRIFVSDFDATQVYDPSGKYLNYLHGGFDGIALDSQNNLYGINAYLNNVSEFQIQKP
jgi:LSD1 subclass zinc finger protein